MCELLQNNLKGEDIEGGERAEYKIQRQLIWPV
jgi:hypothetical protein